MIWEYSIIKYITTSIEECMNIHIRDKYDYKKPHIIYSDLTNLAPNI